MHLLKKAPSALWNVDPGSFGASVRKRIPGLGMAMSLSLLLALPLVSPAQVSFAEFPIPSGNTSHPQGITVGSDGAIWFVESSTDTGQPAIGRVDVNGVFTEYSSGLPAGSLPQQIVAGPDGNLYFTGGNYIGQLTPAGVLTKYTIPNLGSNIASATGITVGHDGNIWFSEASPEVNAIGAMSTTGNFVTPITIPTPESIPTTLTVGPDNNIWFTEQDTNKIGTVRSGAITEYTIPTANSEPFGIVAGPDGNLWFTERNADQVAKITTGGAVTEYHLVSSGAQPFGITVGADGALWFTEEASNNIGRVTTTGAVSEYAIPTSNSGAYSIVEGADRALWFTEDLAGKIGRISEITFESFQQVPGALTQVSIGADGTIWGINAQQQIFEYTGSGWTLIGGALTQIAVGSKTAVWGLNAQGQIFTWNSATSSWKQIPGGLVKIAVGADGDVWGLNGNASPQSNIYHYNAGTGLFGPVGGSLTEIAVGSAGAVYGLNVDGSIYWYNPGTGYFQLLANSSGFDQPPSTGFGKTLAVGVDGDLWATKGGVAYHYNVLRDRFDSTGQTMTQIAVGSGAAVFGLNASGQIFQWDATSQTWVQLSGSLGSIAAGANGVVWGINSSQQIFRLGGAALRAYQTANVIPGAALDQIAVGVDGSVWGLHSGTVEWFNSGTQTFQAVPGAPTVSQLSVGARGDVWGVSASGAIYEYNASAGTWTSPGGELNYIQASEGPLPYGSVWGINSSGQIFTYNFSNNSWTNIPGALALPSQLPGQGRPLSLAADGTVWGINSGQQVYRFSGTAVPLNGSFVNVPGALVQVAVGNANTVWGVNASGEVYYYKNGWVNIPGAELNDVSVSFDGSVWGVNAAGSLYRWNPGTSNFTLFGTGVSAAVVGNAVNVWAFGTGGVFLLF